MKIFCNQANLLIIGVIMALAGETFRISVANRLNSVRRVKRVRVLPQSEGVSYK